MGFQAWDSKHGVGQLLLNNEVRQRWTEANEWGSWVWVCLIHVDICRAQQWSGAKVEQSTYGDDSTNIQQHAHAKINNTATTAQTTNKTRAGRNQQYCDDSTNIQQHAHAKIINTATTAHTCTSWVRILVWMWLIYQATSISTYTCTQHITHTFAYTHRITHIHIYACTYAHTQIHIHPMDDVLGVDVAHPPCNVEEHTHAHNISHTHICIHTSYHTHMHAHMHTHKHTHPMDDVLGVDVAHPPCNVDEHTHMHNISHTYAYTHHITHTHIYSCTYAHTFAPHGWRSWCGCGSSPVQHQWARTHAHNISHTHICIHTSYHTHIYSCTYAHTHTHTHPMDDVLGVDVAHPPCNVDEHAQYGVQVRDLGRGVEQVSVKRFSQRASVTVLLCEANAQYVRINQNCMQALHNDAAQWQNMRKLFPDRGYLRSGSGPGRIRYHPFMEGGTDGCVLIKHSVTELKICNSTPVRSKTGGRHWCVCSYNRVGQNRMCTVYVRYFWQTYGHIWCIYTVLANPTYKAFSNRIEYMLTIVQVGSCAGQSSSSQRLLCSGTSKLYFLISNFNFSFFFVQDIPAFHTCPEQTS